MTAPATPPASPAPDAAPQACYDEANAKAYVWTGPSAAQQGKCTAAQISKLISECIDGNTATQAKCDAYQASADYSFPPPDPQVFGLAAQDHAWVQRRQTPHPGHTYEAPLQFDVQRVGSVARTFVNCTQPPLATIDVIRTRVVDAKFWEGHWLNGAGPQRTVELRTGHDPMISDPQTLTNLLLDCTA